MYKQKTDGKWKIQHNALFARLETFISRCSDLFQMCNTIKE